MKTTLTALSLAALAAMGSAPAAAQPATDARAAELGREARIPFADHGGIRDWHAESSDVLLIEARGGRWYRAELMGHCLDLRFSTALGFETNHDGSFDRFSTIHTRNDTCHVRSLTQIPEPVES